MQRTVLVLPCRRRGRVTLRCPALASPLSLDIFPGTRLLSYDPYDEGTFCRSRFWLLMAYGGWVQARALGGDGRWRGRQQPSRSPPAVISQQVALLLCPEQS